MDLSSLYQEVIIDHNKFPRNYSEMESPSHKADGFNPLCGDKMTLFLKVVDGVIIDASFQGAGCAISMASSSLMTDFLKNKTVEEAKQLFAEFREMVTQDDSSVNRDALGKLAVLEGVKQFPSRVKCATLAWHTLVAAIDNSQAPATTE